MGGRPHGTRTIEGQLVGREMRGRQTTGCNKEGKEVKNTSRGRSEERNIYMEEALLTGVRSRTMPDREGGLTREVQHRLLDYWLVHVLVPRCLHCRGRNQLVFIATEG